MTQEEYADAIIRMLWQHYDHGGLSGRVLKAQLLETVWRRGCEVPAIPVCNETQRAVEDLMQGRVLETQLLLFTDARLLPDHEHRCVVICAMHALHQKEVDPSYIERIALGSLMRLYGLDDPAGYYRALAEQYDPYELLSASWERSWVWDSSFGLIRYD